MDGFDKLIRGPQPNEIGRHENDSRHFGDGQIEFRRIIARLFEQLISTMTISKNFQFHIIGAGRSGTSLLGGVVDAHPDLCVIMERHSIRHLLGRTESSAANDIDMTARIRARVDNYLNACSEEASKLPSLIFGHKTTTEQIGGLAFASPSADIWTESSINTSIAQFDAPSYFAKRVADSKVIFILRDGRACVRSKVRRASRSVENAVVAWKFSIRTFRILREACPNFHFLKFEDLLCDPTTELEKVCDFLGVEFDPVMLKGTENKKIGESYRRPGFDRSAMLIEDGDDAVTAAMREDLVALGYLE